MGVTNENLEAFIVDTQNDLEELKRSFKTFNIFKVLGVQRREIRHSNFIGWLLTPQESHQLGDVFLKSFFKVLREIEDIFTSDQYLELLLANLNNTKVYREREDIDILIVNQSIGLVICIENKIDADYSKKQLHKYYEYVEEHFDYLDNRIYLTLTPFDNDNHNNPIYESGDNYINITYSSILEILTSNKNAIEDASPTVKESIKQYIAIVEKDIIKMSTEILLAREIYKKYRRELNFIMQNKPDFTTYREEVKSLFKDGKVPLLTPSHKADKSIIRVLPTEKTLRDRFDFPKLGCWGGEYLFCLEFFVEPRSIWVKWCFGRIWSPERNYKAQETKATILAKMKKFTSLKNPKIQITTRSKATSGYPAACKATLLTETDLLNNDAPFEQLFLEKMEVFNASILQPWIDECKEELEDLTKLQGL